MIKFVSRFLILACLVFWYASAHATNYYISPTGSNGNSGTSTSAPFLTCDYAASKAINPGDNVYFMDGTHSSSVGTYYCDIYSQGTESQPITFKALNKGKAIIDGAYSESRPYGFILRAGAKHIKIEDLEIKRFREVGVRGNGSKNDGSPIYSENITLKNLYIHHIADNAVFPCSDSYGKSGIFTDQWTRNYTVDSCTIHTTGRKYNTACYDSEGKLLPGAVSQTAHDHGWYMQGQKHALVNSVVYDCFAGWAVKIDGYCSPLAENVDNIAIGDWTHRLSNNSFAYGTRPTTTGGLITFVNNATAACLPKNGASQPFLTPHDVIVENNIFQDSNGASIRFYYTNYFLRTVLRNNITDASALYFFFNTSRGADTSTISVNSNNILSYPTDKFFVSISDMSDPNFNTQADFYGIDRGYNNGLDHDIIGTSRPAGTAIDIGAYENIAPDAIAPTILSTSSTSPNATYATGAEIPITVTFSEPVTSTGNVTVTLNTGGTCTFTASAESSGSCTYTVLAGDYTARLQVASVSGTIADAESNAMTVFTIPSNMVSNNIVISTPSVAITSPAATDTYSTTDSFVTVSGTAGGAAEISSVTWYCPSCTPASGTATGTTSWSIADLGLAFFANTITVTATDSESATVTDTIVITRAEGDTAAPTISNAFPTSAISCTASVSVGLTTDETSTCKLDSTITDYDTMTTTMTASGNSHLAALMLPCNASYTYYARCKDASGNISEATPISFSTTTPPPGVNLTGITSCNGCNF